MEIHLWLNTALSFVALALSYRALTRDKAKIKVIAIKNNIIIRSSIMTELKKINYVIKVTNTGRRSVVLDQVIAFLPGGKQYYPNEETRNVELSEGEIKEFSIYLQNIADLQSTQYLDHFQEVVIDSTGKRWYSKSEKTSQNIKFLWYRLMRKIKARSFSNI